VGIVTPSGKLAIGREKWQDTFGCVCFLSACSEIGSLP